MAETQGALEAGVVAEPPRDRTLPRIATRGGLLAAGALSVVYTFNFLDRQLLTVLAQPVKTELHLTDLQLGLLTGPAFALFYTFFGIPVAALSDRTSRIRIVSAAFAIWSLFSAACGLVGGFATLALARVGVGVGEAGGSPPSYSLISDYYPPERRGAALAIYSLGVPLGTLFGAALGAKIAAAFGWRAAFLTLGGVGLLCSPLLLLVIKEPARGAFDADAPTLHDPPPGVLATVGVFLRTPKLLFTALAAGLTTFVGYANLNWMPAWLMRERGMTLGDIAAYYSVMMGVSMAIGTYVPGALVDRLGRRSPAAYALVPGIAILVSLPVYAGLLQSTDWRVSLALLFIPSVCGMAYLAPGLAVVQNAVRPGRRGVAGAIYLFFLNLIGLGGGPTFVGFVSDRFKAGGAPHALTHALWALTPVFGLAFACQMLAAWCIHRDRRTGI